MSSRAVTAAFVMALAVVQAGGANTGTSGTLTTAAPGATSFPTGAPAAEFIAGPKPNCEPKFLGAVGADVLQALGVSQPAEIGVVMTVLDQPVMLHKLQLQLRDQGQAFFETEVYCGGCMQQYPPVSDDAKGVHGYAFRLDATALQATAPLFGKATEFGLAGVLHDGGRIRLSFVKLEAQN